MNHPIDRLKLRVSSLSSVLPVEQTRKPSNWLSVYPSTGPLSGPGCNLVARLEPALKNSAHPVGRGIESDEVEGWQRPERLLCLKRPAVLEEILQAILALELIDLLVANQPDESS